MRFGLTLTGADQAADQLRGLPAKIQGAPLYAALHRAAGVIQAAVQAAAPVGTEPSRKTRRIQSAFVLRGRQRRKLRLSTPVSVSYDYGRLRENIRRRRERFNRTGNIAVSVTRGRAFWAFFLEEGTRRMRPHPFWQAAARRAEAASRDEFEKAFRAALATALARAPR